jgi:hypothetical protein
MIGRRAEDVYDIDTVLRPLKINGHRLLPLKSPYFSVLH